MAKDLAGVINELVEKGYKVEDSYITSAGRFDKYVLRNLGISTKTQRKPVGLALVEAA